MKKNNIMTRVSGVVNQIGFQLKKHSPEILVVAGVAGTIVAGIMACKATVKATGVLDDAKQEIDKIHERMEHGCTEAGQEYTADDSKKELTAAYLKTGVELGKLYAPSIALGALSVTGILASNNILRKRYIASAAAYATIDKSFKEYRNRVIEQFGEEVDHKLRFNAKPKEIVETITDENGNEQTVTVVRNCVNPEDVSGYARYFEELTRDENGQTIKNPYWENNPDYNLMFLKSQQRYFNQLLVTKKRVFLNEVYEALGLPVSKAGQVVGWVYDPESGRGDNYIDFGIFASNQNYSDFVYGNDPAILLDFNVDGNIWELMK